MIGTIIWLIGLVCAIWCVLDIFKKNISTAGKVIASVVVLLTSWVGFAVYYFYGRRSTRRSRPCATERRISSPNPST